MTAAALVKSGPRNGLQPLDLARHLGGLASLLELCFGNELDANGRGMIREMQWLSRAGPALHLLPVLTLGQQPWNLGYVWVEDGRVVGSVSTQRAAPRSDTWLVANVAVHPDHRRRGIALALMQATLDMLRGKGAAEVILQVEDDNLGAIFLYRQLGFGHVTTRMAWTRPGYTTSPAYEPAADLHIRLRGHGEWAAQLALARRVSAEGLAWGKPLRETDFRPTALTVLGQFVSGRQVEHWVAIASRPTEPLAGADPAASHSPWQTGGLIGSLTVTTGATGSDRLDLLVHPDWRGKAEHPLLVRGLRRLGRRPWAARLEYNADDSHAARILRDLGFQGGRILRWMQARLA
jgi:ribosomal protein S18 acetylase RimI-like enzyme